MVGLYHWKYWGKSILFTCLFLYLHFTPEFWRDFVNFWKKVGVSFAFSVLVCLFFFFWSFLIYIPLHLLQDFSEIFFFWRVLCLYSYTIKVKALWDNMHWGVILSWDNWPVEGVAKLTHHTPRGYFLLLCYKAASLSLVDSDSYSDSLSVDFFRESGSQVPYALEAPGELQLSLTDH